MNQITKAYKFHLARRWQIFLSIFIFLSIGSSLLIKDPYFRNTLAKPVYRQLKSGLYTVQNRIAYPELNRSEPPAAGVATGPLRVNPSNPRYFMDGNGKNVYLAGSHAWNNLQDSGSIQNLPYLFDYPKWLDFLQANNHNFFQLWVWGQAKWVGESTTPYYFAPMPYQRTGPGMALDGLPKFDLTKFNQAFFDRMRARIMQAGNRGIYVSIILFNGWSTDTKAAWGGGKSFPFDGHPFNKDNNINGIDGDPNGDRLGLEVEGLTIPQVTNIQDAYVRKVVDTLNDLDNVLYQVCVECNPDSVAWQYHMVELIHTYQQSKPQQHPVGLSQISFNDAELFNSEAEWVSIHDSGSLESPYIADGSKVVIVDTDHICGICGNRQWVWKSFTRGKHTQFMDQYDDSYKWLGGGYIMNNPNDVSLRLNMGYTIDYAARMNLAAMTPRPNLCSTGYCLANPAANGAEYLVYQPIGGPFQVNLSSIPASTLLKVEWFNPANGQTIPGGTVAGGASHTFIPPFSGDAVLYVFNADFTPGQVFIGETSMGSLNLPSTPTSRISFTNKSGGPLKILSKDGASIFGSERVIYKVNGVNTSFSEMMGLPANQLDTTYWLPWYDNKDLDTQLRIGNPSNSPATIQILIGGQPVPGSPFTLAAGKSLRKSFIGIKKGPVKIVSNVPIVAAERIIYKVNGNPISYSEMMALPAGQVDMTYWLPWYNYKDLITQLWIANVSNSTATVQVQIGGANVTGSPFTLAAGAVRRLVFPGLDKGPVKIQSNQNIVAAERVIYRVNGSPVSLSEIMALPNRQLDATFWLPWYDNKNLDTQLRFANVTTIPASVHVYVGGQEMTGSPFALAPGKSTRRSFVNINNGPVKIVSNVNIVVAERVIYKVNGVNTSFSEMMALPTSQLGNTYWLPWYNNQDLNTELRIGVPK